MMIPQHTSGLYLPTSGWVQPRLPTEEDLIMNNLCTNLALFFGRVGTYEAIRGKVSSEGTPATITKRLYALFEANIPDCIKRIREPLDPKPSNEWIAAYVIQESVREGSQILKELDDSIPEMDEVEPLFAEIRKQSKKIDEAFRNANTFDIRGWMKGHHALLKKEITYLDLRESFVPKNGPFAARFLKQLAGLETLLLNRKQLEKLNNPEEPITSSLRHVIVQYRQQDIGSLQICPPTFHNLQRPDPSLVKLFSENFSVQVEFGRALTLKEKAIRLLSKIGAPIKQRVLWFIHGPLFKASSFLLDKSKKFGQFLSRQCKVLLRMRG